MTDYTRRAAGSRSGIRHQEKAGGSYGLGNLSFDLPPRRFAPRLLFQEGSRNFKRTHHPLQGGLDHGNNSLISCVDFQLEYAINKALGDFANRCSLFLTSMRDLRNVGPRPYPISRRNMKLRAALALVVLPFVGLAFGQTVTTQSQATAAIRGRIADDLTHEGVSTARVTLTGNTIKDPVVATSDGQGNVLFSALAPGRYSLAIDKAGYFTQTYPDIVVSGATLGTGDVKLGDLNITAQRTISGIVRWDDGEPVTNAVVHAMNFRGGAYSRSPFLSPVTTNDRGEFKLEGVRARRYLLFTYQRPQVVMPGAAVRVALPVFYPATNRPETADILDMRNQKDVSGIVLTMKEEKGESVEGKIIADTLPEGTPVQLGLVIPGVSAPFLVATQSKVGATFRLYPVPPGSYLLFAQGGGPGPIVLPAGIDPTTITAEQVALLRANATSTEPVTIAIPVTVSRGTSIRDMTLSFPAPTPLVGKVEVEEAAPGQSAKLSPVPNANLFLEWVPKIELNYGFVTGGTDKNGEFRLTNAVKGQAYVSGPGSNFPGGYVASIKQGQNDLLAGALPMIAGGDPVRVLLKRDGGSVKVTVKDETTTPWRAFVVAAPRDRRIEYWFIRGFTMSDGTITLSGLPPGEYDVFAFDRNDEDIFYNADFLRRYVRNSAPISVAPNSSQSLTLGLIKTAP